MIRKEIAEAACNLGEGPLTESTLSAHVWPLFSRVLGCCAANSEIYLANHSLGRPPDLAFRDIAEGASLWADSLDRAWEEGGWLDNLDRFRQCVGALLGIADHRQIVPKTSAGQGLRAVLNSMSEQWPVNIVTTTAEFDSIDFILKAYAESGAANVAWIEPRETDIPTIESEDLIGAINEGTDLVVISHTYFQSGQILQGLDQVVNRARSVGANTVLDVYHAAGVVPLDVPALGCDFAIGGSYKYLRGGPGACWLALSNLVAEKDSKTLDTGWFAKSDTFGYERASKTRRKPSGDGWLESTPPVLTSYQAMAGTELALSIGIERIREHSLKQKAILADELERSGFDVLPSSVGEKHGAFVVCRHSSAPNVARELARHGVTVDARGQFVRFCADILTSADEISETRRRCAGLALGTGR